MFAINSEALCVELRLLKA